MWACSRGHIETAIILYKWNQNALNVKNSVQQTPMEVAKNRGFPGLVAELEKHELQRLQNKKSQAPTSSSMSTLASITSSCSTSSTSTLSTLASSASADSSSVPSSASLTNPSTTLANSSGSSSNGTRRSAAAETANQHSNNDNDSNNHPDDSPEHNFINDLFNYNDALNSSNSDSCSNDNFALSSSYNPSLSPYSDMKGSGQIGSSSMTALHYALENNNSNPMLSNALSPNSDSNRSHDGVFLRPGAVFSR